MQWMFTRCSESVCGGVTLVSVVFVGSLLFFCNGVFAHSCSLEIYGNALTACRSYCLPDTLC